MTVDAQPPVAPATDLNRWRLKVDHGAQTWHYLQTDEEIAAWPQTAYDKYWLGILKDETQFDAPTTVLDAARNGLRFLRQLQTADGHFAAEYGGPMFLIPGIVISMYITGAKFPAGFDVEIVRYLRSRANKKDGGWGLHIEGDSTCFGTSLNYVAMRLLGVPVNDPDLVKARTTLWRLGGATGVPAWGKFWLSVLNVYDWAGNNPIPPELWAIPYTMNPIQAGRMWCHTRMVYLPMSVLYAKRFKAEPNELILSLREELYPCNYSEIVWHKMRNHVAKVDIQSPHSVVLDALNTAASTYEYLPNSIVRSYAVNEAIRQIRMEDKNTNYLNLGPVNKAMNLLVMYVVDGPDSESFKRHVERLWDTAFAVQASLEAGLAQEEEFHSMFQKAYDFMDDMQIRHNMENYKQCYRHISKGAWPFSTREQSYTVSDCTAEGLKSVLLTHKALTYVKPTVTDDRIFDAVNVLLSMQNADGGFASYELQRSTPWLEHLNPSEVFGNIMVEYSYPECTTAVLLSLTSFRKHHPKHRRSEVDRAIKRAVAFIRKSQRPDGLWYGSWGICFTYATFFAIESLSSVGETYENSASVRRACDALAARQMEDGGWGESYRACETREWVDHEQSQVVQTAWAIMALMAAKYPTTLAIKAGVALIMSRQLPNGEWAQEAIEGVFNKSCMISYPNYKFVFPVWALSRYSRMYEATNGSQ
ncbi:terpenoid cyclases/protein prenyltransferase alpha-alpha toroid [Entophlyctis helioformis]|nr:terpenoid cyclases/protein prenyltransferase alpha-alpha toroid [Entophlyctis helioformis]